MRRLAVGKLAGLALVGLLLVQGCGSRPESDTAGQVLAEARQAWLAGDFPQAEADYQRYLQAFPQGADRLEAWKRLADIAYAVRGQAAAALTLLEAGLLEKGIDEARFFELAGLAVETAMASRQYAKAAALARELLARDGAPSALVVQATVALEQALDAQGDGRGAREALEQCRTRLGDDIASAPCSLRLGLLLSGQESKEAQAIFQGLYDNGAVEARIRAQAGFALGEAAEARQDKATARTWYEAVKNSYPNPMVIAKKLELLGK
jgi:tetratricopeptide (TPR) repeat protein